MSDPTREHDGEGSPLLANVWNREVIAWSDGFGDGQSGYGTGDGCGCGGVGDIYCGDGESALPE